MVQRWYFAALLLCLVLNECYLSRGNSNVGTANEKTKAATATAAAWGGGGRRGHPIHTQPIRIGLSIDDYSMKDFLVVMASALNAAENPNRVIFHLVACAKDMETAKTLQHQIVAAIGACLPAAKYHVVPFMLPPDSGFALQLAAAKRKSHWISSSGADMVRFFMASLFPKVRRLLYLDNDIVVSCCLEEIYYSTELNKPDKIVGIALDNLQWATVTQFRFHYNASHPLVALNIRRRPTTKSNLTSTSTTTTGNSAAAASAAGDITSSSLSSSVTSVSTIDLTEPVSEKEFHKALPRYPNDGVLLIDVQRYNAAKVLQSIDDVARANARGEYVVGLGTQQFTVLALHDRWVELTPRANLRHFPDMARGYLMWFYYNGFIHFAGQAKPRSVCGARYSDNDLRINTYTPWATTVLSLQKTCSPPPETAGTPSIPGTGAVGATTTATTTAASTSPVPFGMSARAWSKGAKVPKSGFEWVEAEGCADLLLKAPTFPSLLALVTRIASISLDENLWYLRIGAFSSDLTGIEPYLKPPPKTPTTPPGKKGSGKSSKKSDKASGMSMNMANSNGNTTGGGVTVGTPTSMETNGSMVTALVLRGRHMRGLEALDRLVLGHTAWSVRIADRDPQRLKAAENQLEKGLGSAPASTPGLSRISKVKSEGVVSVGASKGKGKKDKESPQRTWGMLPSALCDHLPAHSLVSAHVQSVSKELHNPAVTTTVTDTSSGSTPSPSTPTSKCVSLLQEMKSLGKKHWDMVAIVIDYQPTVALPWSNSVSVLRQLDLVFMRPKVLVVRVGPRSFHGFNQKPSSKWDDRLVQLWEDVEETARVLKRLGYITYQDKEGYCDSTSLDYQVDYFANRANNGWSGAGSSSSLPPYNSNGTSRPIYVPSLMHIYDYHLPPSSFQLCATIIPSLSLLHPFLDANPKTSGGSAGMESFVCVWGTRVNSLEFGGATWGKW